MTALPDDVNPAMKPITTDRFNEASLGNFHEWLGFEVTKVGVGFIEARMTVREEQLNPGNGLHGGVSASLADALCGYAVFTALPEGAEGFTTIGLQSSYLGRASLGDELVASAKLIKGGRQLQVWDVSISQKTSAKLIAEARITQLLRYPR